MVSVSIDSSDLKKLVRQLERMQAKIPQAVARGLNEGGDKVRTQVQRALQRQTSLVRYSSVTSRVRTIRAFGEGAAPKSGIGPMRPGSLSYSIVVTGKPTKPPEFKTRVVKGPGGGVIMLVWNSPHKFRRSFQISSGAGAGALKARLSKKRKPLRGFDGPNLAKEAVRDESAKAFFETTASAVAPAIEKHLMKALGGS
jgi:hypothetical protein